MDMGEPWRVLVTPRSLDVEAYGLTTALEQAGCSVVRVVGPLDSGALAAAWESVDAAILGLDDASASAIDRAERLRVISRYGTGYDRVDILAASRRGIAVTVTPGTNHDSVAEIAVGLAIALARGFGTTLSTAPAFGPATPGMELAGKVFGIVGLGRVGAAVAERVRALRMRVVYSDVAPRPSLEGSLGLERVSLDDLLRSSDVISLHASLTPETRGVINARSLSLMKPGAFLVNTARGELVDEVALADSLWNGRLGGAALDVRLVEQPNQHDPLLGVPRMLFTPHLGSRTAEAGRRMAETAVGNVIAIKRGQRPDGLLNPEAL